MRSRLVALVLAALGLVGGGLTTVPAAAAPTWAPADSAPIRPGVQLVTGDAQCTANFVFTEGERVFIGQAAHCSGTGGNTAVDGCDQPSRPLPIGTPVDILGFDGRTYTGELVYSSWNTMDDVGEKNEEACFNNDFALVEVPAAHVGKVNPSLPYWGGPTGTRSGSLSAGTEVLTYGNSGLRFGIEALSPKSGTSLGTAEAGWRHTVLTVTPGIPGDSGSAVLDGRGRALGVLVTVAVVPPATNGVSDLAHLVGYARAHGGLPGLTLATGTEPLDRHPVAGLASPLG